MVMTKILSININFGIGMILKFYYLFEKILETHADHIYVSIDKRILAQYRGENETFFTNYIKFFQYLNEHPNIHIEDTYNEKYPNVEIDTLANALHIPIRFKCFPKLSILPSPFQFPYVTLSVKIMTTPNSLFINFKKEFFQRLNAMSAKVVLLGEREISDCVEYRIHETYSIYKDCIQELTNFEDRTIQDNTKNNELSSLLESCSILANSKLNIYIGTGGVSELIPYCSNNILGLTSKDIVLQKQNYLHESTINIKVFDDVTRFLENLKI